MEIHEGTARNTWKKEKHLNLYAYFKRAAGNGVKMITEKVERAKNRRNNESQFKLQAITS